MYWCQIKISETEDHFKVITAIPIKFVRLVVTSINGHTLSPKESSRKRTHSDYPQTLSLSLCGFQTLRLDLWAFIWAPGLWGTTLGNSKCLRWRRFPGKCHWPLPRHSGLVFFFFFFFGFTSQTLWISSLYSSLSFAVGELAETRFLVRPPWLALSGRLKSPRLTQSLSWVLLWLCDFSIPWKYYVIMQQFGFMDKF